MVSPHVPSCGDEVLGHVHVQMVRRKLMCLLPTLEWKQLDTRRDIFDFVPYSPQYTCLPILLEKGPRNAYLGNERKEAEIENVTPW